MSEQILETAVSFGFLFCENVNSKPLVPYRSSGFFVIGGSFMKP